METPRKLDETIVVGIVLDRFFRSEDAEQLVEMAKAFQLLPDFDWQRTKLESLLKDARLKIQETCERQLAKTSDDIGHDIKITRVVSTAKYAAQGILAEAEA